MARFLPECERKSGDIKTKHPRKGQGGREYLSRAREPYGRGSSGRAYP